MTLVRSTPAAEASLVARATIAGDVPAPASAPNVITTIVVLTRFACSLLLLLAAAGCDTTTDPMVETGEVMARRGDGVAGVAQDFVVCTGWHALCSASPDCRMKGDKADCDCMRVNETHIVATAEIQDPAVGRLTRSTCTNQHPCDVDQAPVCKAIKTGQYRVDDVKYDWVSTYSYRGWCSLLKVNLVACDQRAAGYAGDRYWAICDAAPCTENRNPLDPARPLTCQCRVEDTPFVGVNGSCTGDDGGIMSSFASWAWDFENHTYPFPMPGYEYVRGACAPVESDPVRGSRSDGKPR